MFDKRFLSMFHRRLIALVQIPRILFYRALSMRCCVGNPRVLQPVQIVGKGKVEFNGNVTIGYYPSPFFLSGYSYIEARDLSGHITIGDGTIINNNFVAISVSKGIYIGEKVLIGTHVEIYDSDFHSLDASQRNTCNIQDDKKVCIEDNVFIGSNVKILKGVKIGKDSVVANGSIVAKDIPPGVVAGGIPAKVIRSL